MPSGIPSTPLPTFAQRLLLRMEHPYAPLILVTLTALVSCALFAWCHDIRDEGFRRYMPAIDNLKQARLLLGKGYLNSELALTGDTSTSQIEALNLIDLASLTIEDCRTGRSTLSDYFGMPLDDPRLLAQLNRYDSSIREFRQEVQRTFQAGHRDPTRSSLVLKPLFSDIARQAEGIDRELHAQFRDHLALQHDILIVTLGIWLLFLLVLGWILQLSLRARKFAETELRNREENLRITLNSIGDAVIVTDACGQVVNLNPVAEQLIGLSLEAAQQQPLESVFRIINAQSRQKVENPVSTVLREGRVVGLANHTVLLSHAGTEYHIADSGAPIRDATGEIQGVVLVFRDVTEQYALEEQLHQSQKMEAIGQLAGGVAHDFNNALGAILGGAQLLRQNVPQSDKMLRYTNMIEQAADRAAHLTRQLLAYSRKGNVQSVSVNINTAVGNVCSILEHAIDKRIEIRTELHMEPIYTTGDPAQIENALLNLAVNARDAMPCGGILEIGTRLTTLDAAFAQHHPFSVPPGEYIELLVRDTGVGMTKEIAAHIFEPFFTTKGVGAGTGLGLAAVYGTVKEHGGTLNVYSEPGKGTCFQLYFPHTRQRPLLPKLPPQTPVRGSGCILVVEDEVLLQQLAQELLEDLGYRVLIAADGESGLHTYQSQQGEIDLVILDLMMPRMGGEDLFYRLRTINPAVRVLIASGFGTQGIAQQLLAAGANAYVRKPYSLADLSIGVTEALGISRPPLE